MVLASMSFDSVGASSKTPSSEVAGLLGRDSSTGKDDFCVPSLFGTINYMPAVYETDEGDKGCCLSDCLSPSLTQYY